MNAKVMIVDDEPDVLDSLKTVLEKQDYEVITVESGSECLKQLEEGFKGIILMDIMMPEMNGWDIIREIVNRGHIKDVAINIVTAYGDKEQQSMGVLQPYIYDFLAKPVDINELITSVEKCNLFLSARENMK